ncbi:MAG: hypothetical protein J6A75_11205 [Lachnospiraceae bacterium]|nr:hypothetical protein [Lachnospiraceae bacterium]
MKFTYEIPASFWGLFRSINREIYIEALLTIHDEYQYNNYFLSREACIQILGDMCARRRFQMEKEEIETEEEAAESMPRRILNWLIRTKWLRKLEDYTTMTTNIIIPDYAAIMIEAFEKLANEPEEDTDIYIQNVYATLYSFLHDKKLNTAMLKTALVNTKKLNKALQDMLHNMDKFFGRLLEKDTYAGLLEEHLEGYVEEVVKKKYHILKTSDNFYLYKMDIKRCIKELREDDTWITLLQQKETAKSKREAKQSKERFFQSRRSEDVLDILDQIERGFEDIEHRITNMDKEHSKYVRATVNRLNYLLSEESDRKGLMIQLLNYLGQGEEKEIEKKLRIVSEKLNLSSLDILSENPLFRRRRRQKFTDALKAEENPQELSKEDILKMNRIAHRFSKEEITAFIEEHMTEGMWQSKTLQIRNDEEFEKLILAYDLAIRKNGEFEVLTEGVMLEDGKYRYPAMTFIRKQKGSDGHV